MSADADVRVLEGGCACGAVRYRAGGPPRNACYCHCESCRRASGGATVAWFSVDTPSFALTRGELVQRASSPGVTRGHCAACGTSITYHNARRPLDMDVTTASLDDPGAAPPRAHLWARDRPAWLALDPALPIRDEVPAPWTLRHALATDAPALAALAEATFRETFGRDNAPADMDAHCARHYGVAQQAREIADPAMLTLLAERDGQLVGFGQLHRGPGPAGLAAARPAEVRRLYVARGMHGSGLGRELMEALLEAARTGGADCVWLGVWERNPRAIAFYRKSGYAAFGEHVFTVGSDPQRDVLMARTLA